MAVAPALVVRSRRPMLRFRGCADLRSSCGHCLVSLCDIITRTPVGSDGFESRVYNAAPGECWASRTCKLIMEKDARVGVVHQEFHGHFLWTWEQYSRMKKRRLGRRRVEKGSVYGCGWNASMRFGFPSTLSYDRPASHRLGRKGYIISICVSLV